MSTKDDNNTIQLDISTDSKYLEAICDLVAPAVIWPGMILTYTSAGGVVPHGTAQGPQEGLFAVENPYDGGDIHIEYLEAERVMIRQCRRGDVVLAILANGESVLLGAALSSNGTGYMEPAAVAPLGGSVVGIANEAVNAVVGNVFISITIA